MTRSERRARDVVGGAEPAHRHFRRERRVRGEAAAGDRARRDRVDPDAPGAERARQLLHRHRLAGLRGAVVRQVARRVRVQRRDEEDPSRRPVAALGALAHVPAGGLRQQEAAAQVHVEHLVPLRGRDREGGLRFLAARARGVHQDVDAARRLQRGVEERPRAVRTREVGRKHPRTGARAGVAADAARAADRVGGVAAPRLVQIRDQHRRARAGQRQRDAAADAAGRAGDQRALPVEGRHLARPPTASGARRPRGRTAPRRA